MNLMKKWAVAILEMTLMSKSKKKRYAVIAVLAALLMVTVPAGAACFGFSDEEMPKVVADYICKYESVVGQPLAVSETPGGTIWFIRLSDSNGEHIADVHQAEDADGDLGPILYFVLPDGRVLLDRRANL